MADYSKREASNAEMFRIAETRMPKDWKLPRLPANRAGDRPALRMVEK
jgi:hypothetical protein